MPQAELRYDACFEFAEPVMGDNEMQPARLDGGRFACYRYVGPYEGSAMLSVNYLGCGCPAAGVSLMIARAWKFTAMIPGKRPPSIWSPIS